jgi:serine/threonine protein kinase
MNDELKNTLCVGTVLHDKWVILEFIAKGGMGELYRAHQLNLKRDVAIKVISREWLESLEDDEEELLNGLQRFRNEVQAMAQIRHPNILQIYDHGSTSIVDGERTVPVEYIAMEYIPGGTLRSTMSEEGFYPEEELTRDWLMQYFLPVLDGVEALHEADIVHRDIKPGNVLMDGEIPKIADFGLARSGMLKPVTQSADIKGTPAYMPIEQFLDFRRTDERTDIYALGKVLYEAVDGKMKPNMVPFKKAALKNPNTPFFKALDAVIQKATAEDKDERQNTVDELRSEVLRAIYSLTKKQSKGRARSAVEKKVRFGLPPSSRKWVLLAVAFLALSTLFMVSRIWNIRDWMEYNPPSLKTPQTTGREKQKPLAPPATLSGRDGVTLHLIQGGSIQLPQGFVPEGERSAKVDPFYMDETQVTNHQYVDFLNQVLSRVRVEKGVVKSKGKIWLLLGEALEGYEPIVYRDGRFHITKAEHAACPVIRVTAYGA